MPDTMRAVLCRNPGELEIVHYPVPEWTGLITSIAFPYSPAEITRGASYRFNMNHVVEPASPLEMFPIEYESL